MTDLHYSYQDATRRQVLCGWREGCAERLIIDAGEVPIIEATCLTNGGANVDGWAILLLEQPRAIGAFCPSHWGAVQAAAGQGDKP